MGCSIYIILRVAVKERKGVEKSIMFEDCTAPLVVEEMFFSRIRRMFLSGCRRNAFFGESLLTIGDRK
jgi:hypothetical protein